MNIRINSFLKTQLYIGCSVLFFNIVFNLCSNLLSSSLSLQNINKTSSSNIYKTIHKDLIKNITSKTLSDSFVFFYLDDYSSLQLFTSSNTNTTSSLIPNISKDPFYSSMLNFHKNNLCYVSRTIDIPNDSHIKKDILKEKEDSLYTLYISCPIFIDNILIGYVGGLNYGNVKQTAMYIEISTVQNTAKNIETLLLNN